MNSASQASTSRIVEGHRLGLLDRELAVYAEVSIATVKRVRSRMGLESNCWRNQLGKFGEQWVAEQALQQGLRVEVTPKGAPFDLRIAGLRVEVKTSRETHGDSYHFRFPTKRKSNHLQYQYPKDYQQDADVIALVCVDRETQAVSVYFLHSIHAGPDVRIRPGSKTCPFAGFQNDWSIFDGSTGAV